MCSVRILYVSALALAGHVEALWSVRGARHATWYHDLIFPTYMYTILDDTFAALRCTCMSVRQFDTMRVHTRSGGFSGLGWARYERLSKLTRVGVIVT